jgi:peptidoglycan/xylan/chitin deacetylase (PgdA/CDA1 family)
MALAPAGKKQAVTTAKNPVRVSTLLYHSFASTSTSAFKELTVDPGLFSEHMAALREAGCRFIRFRDIPAVVSGSTTPDGSPHRPVVAVTIDDGFADITTGALPALLEHQIPATLFVPTAYVGATAAWLRDEDGHRAMCDWRSLCDLAASGWEIGSHGHRHIAADLSAPATVTADALRSRTLLEEHLGMPVTSFAYPFGYYSKQSHIAVRNAGFSQAGIVSGQHDRSNDDRWRIPRAQIGPGHTPEDLAILVQRRGGDAKWRNRAKQRLWLFGRRRFAWGPPEAAGVGAADAAGTPAADGTI